MIRLRDLLTESDNHDPIDQILLELEPMIEEQLAAARAEYEADTGKQMSPWAEQTVRLSLVYDLVRALEVYILPGDEIVRMRYSGSPKGSIVISGIIDRGGVEHDITTEVIYAGGYNIQKLHYRYITKTTLPKSTVTPETDRLKRELAGMKRRERDAREIEALQVRIADSQAKLDAALALSEEEIAAAVMNDPNFGQYLNTTWADIVSRGADKNYPGGEAEFDRWLQAARRDAISRWKKANITFRESDIKAAEREIARLEKKLDSIAG